MKAVFILLLFVFLGCKDVAHPPKPENLIGKDKMVEVLTDAYLANAARSINYNPLRDKGVVLDSLIYKKHGIDSLQFAQSNAYYADDLNTYIELFKKVEINLKEMEADWQRKQDSIQNSSAVKDSLR